MANKLPAIPASVPAPMPEGHYSFSLTPEEEAELHEIPANEQAPWLKALATKKRPAGIPGPDSKPRRA